MTKKRFLLRLGTDLYDALAKWAADDLRSVNAQIEYLLTESARRAGRVRKGAGGTGEGDKAELPGMRDEM